MSKEWFQRFADMGAGVDDVGNISFADQPNAADSAINGADFYQMPLLVELSKLAVVDVSGADATQFFQDQICNDLTSLNENQAQLNGYCTPKGRLLALFTVYRQNEGYRVLLPSDVAPAFVKRLTMFASMPIEDKETKRAVFAKVKVTHRADLVCTGLVLDATAASDSLSQLLPDVSATLPAEPMTLDKGEQYDILRWQNPNSENANNAALHRYVIVGELNSNFALWQSDKFNHASWPYWRWCDINDGMPSVVALTTEQFIPQMLNMQVIDGVSFKKGCYPGQEIVARMQYLGKLKKHMQRFYIAGAKEVPLPGDTLTTDSNNNAGQVVDAVVDGNGVSLLAVVNKETAPEDLRANEASLSLQSLPYSLEMPES